MLYMLEEACFDTRQAPNKSYLAPEAGHVHSKEPHTGCMMLQVSNPVQ